MSSHNYFKKNRYFECKTQLAAVVAIVCFFNLFVTNELKSQVTTKEYNNGVDTLVIYKNVPLHTPSEFFTIKVRSALTGNTWVSCFANITRSLYNRLEPGVQIVDNKKEHYYPTVADWSHTYANIEMNKGSLVEVQIIAKNGFKIRGASFTTANAHPAQKATKPSVVSGVITFSVKQLGQIVIDINGQMDGTNTGPGYTGGAVHTVALYANPVIKKPVLGSAGVYEVKVGVAPPTDPTKYTTLYFGPGVHNIGRGFKLYSNKNIYIPGDAVVYGSFNNLDVAAVDNVKIFGYGTLSGDSIKHPNYDPDFKDTKNPDFGDDKAWKVIYTWYCTNFRVEGISISNSQFHTMNFSTGDLKTNETFVEWVKVVTWRGNGDGIGNAHVINDCFIRTQDDCTYVKGDRKRCTFWTDVNGTAFVMAGMPPATERKILIEDCDVIYPRHCSLGWAGGRVFSRRADQAPKEAGQTIVDVTFKDIRITDPYQTLETFQLISKDGDKLSGSYSGIKFINISSVKTPVAGENQIVGWVSSPWSNITFDNVNLGELRIASKDDFAICGPEVYNFTFYNQKAFGGVNRTIPGTIEAEHFDEGGEGYSYHDDATKQGDITIRAAEKVDLLVKSNTAKDVVVGFPVLGEWLEYSVDTDAANYDMTLKYFCNTTSSVGDLKVSMDGVVLGTFTDIVTQGSNTKQAVVTIPDIIIAGGKNKILRLEYVNGARFDIDAIVFTKKAMLVKAVAGIKENPKEVTAISVYPNPVSSILNIDFPDAASSRDVKLFNGLGRLVFSTKTNGANAQIDIKSMDLKGLVVVQVISGTDVLCYRVVVK